MKSPTMVTPFIAWPLGLVLVLASRSPRRAELLQLAGIPFVVEAPGDVEEELGIHLVKAATAPDVYALTLARAKASSVAERMDGRLVLGADTIVIIDGDILEKPRDRAEAVAMLGRLAGRRHTVITAIALAGGSAAGLMAGALAAYERTEVEFVPLTAAAIERYVDTAEPMDKAGAYGIQGYGAMMVRRIEGCYFNVMGLPLASLGLLLNTLPGLRFPEES